MTEFFAGINTGKYISSQLQAKLTRCWIFIARRSDECSLLGIRQCNLSDPLDLNDLGHVKHGVVSNWVFIPGRVGTLLRELLHHLQFAVNAPRVADESNGATACSEWQSRTGREEHRLGKRHLVDEQNRKVQPCACLVYVHFMPDCNHTVRDFVKICESNSNFQHKPNSDQANFVYRLQRWSVFPVKRGLRYRKVTFCSSVPMC